MSESGMLCPLSWLRTKDRRELLEPLHERSESAGILHLLKGLPQIVVCGNRSSGKSSILQAISGQAFPIKKDFGTRFPIELTLCKGVEQPTRIWIRADTTRCEADIRRLGGYRQKLDGKPNLESIIRKAECFLGISESDEILRDTLCIDLYGPNYPHLTLIDLPGLLEAQDTVKNNTANAEKIRTLVRRYISKPGTVILAAVSGQNMYNDRPIKELSKLIGPKRVWTLFVLTKPDAIPINSLSEEKYIKFVSNKEAGFCLRWHVLRNKTPLEGHCNMKQRDETERKLFNQSKWNSLEPNCLGVEALRLRINDMLKSQVILELQNHAHTLKLELPKCRKTLNRLGPCYTSITGIESYLTRTGNSIGDLIYAAFLGDYTCSFFTDGQELENDQRRLRAVIRSIGDTFVERMRKEGHAKEIVGNDTVPTDRQICRDTFINGVQQIIKNYRGLELPGTFNPQVLQVLFEEQIAPWNAIIDKFEHDIIEAIRTTVKQAVCYIADRHTADHIMKKVQIGMGQLEKSLRMEIRSIRGRIVKGHLVMYNQYYIQDMRKARSAVHEQRLRQHLKPYFMEKDKKTCIESDLDTVIHTICKTIEELDLDRYANTQATYALESYYNIALEHVIENITQLLAEQKFIMNLVTFFHRDIVGSLGQETIRSIALENEHASIGRRIVFDKICRMEKQLTEIRQYEDYCTSTQEPLSVVHTRPYMTRKINTKLTDLKAENSAAKQNATEPKETLGSIAEPPTTSSTLSSLSSPASLSVSADLDTRSTNKDQRSCSPTNFPTIMHADSESRSYASSTTLENLEENSTTASRRSSTSQRSHDSSEYVFPNVTQLPDPALASLSDPSQFNG